MTTYVLDYPWAQLSGSVETFVKCPRVIGKIAKIDISTNVLIKDTWIQYILTRVSICCSKSGNAWMSNLLSPFKAYKAVHMALSTSPYISAEALLGFWINWWMDCIIWLNRSLNIVDTYRNISGACYMCLQRVCANQKHKQHGQEHTCSSIFWLAGSFFEHSALMTWCRAYNARCWASRLCAFILSLSKADGGGPDTDTVNVDCIIVTSACNKSGL